MPFCWLLSSGILELKDPNMTYKIERTADKGRCVTTTASLRWGDVVLEQEPYAAVLYDDQHKRCHYSFAAAAEAGKCVRTAS